MGTHPHFSKRGRLPRLPGTSSLKRKWIRSRLSLHVSLTRSPRNHSAIEFLPVGEIKSLKIPGAESEEKLALDTTESLFEPNPEAVLGYLLSHYLDIYIYQVLLNAKASEQSARMVSMKNATDSAENLIDDLNLEYNKLRQGNITKELLEIAGGQSELNRNRFGNDAKQA